MLYKAGGVAFFSDSFCKLQVEVEVFDDPACGVLCGRLNVYVWEAEPYD